MTKIKAKPYIISVTEADTENPRQFDYIEFNPCIEAIKDLALNKASTHFLVMERSFKKIQGYVRTKTPLPQYLRARLSALNTKILNDDRFTNLTSDHVQIGLWDSNERKTKYLIFKNEKMYKQAVFDIEIKLIFMFVRVDS